MAFAGKDALVKIAGAASSFTTAATTSADDRVYQLSSTTYQGLPFAPDVAITVQTSSGGAYSSTSYTLNRLNGSVIFATSASRGACTVTGSYLPMSDAARAREYNISITGSNADATVFGKDWMVREQAQLDVTGSIGAFFSSQHSTQLGEVLTSTARQPTAIDIYHTSTAVFAMRLWALLANDGLDASVDGMIENGVEFEGAFDADDRIITFSTASSS